jgi:hypothetical protein
LNFFSSSSICALRALVSASLAATAAWFLASAAAMSFSMRASFS